MDFEAKRYMKNPDYILGSERHLEILPAAYQEKGCTSKETR